MKDAFGQPQSVLVLGGGSDIGVAIVQELAKRQLDTVILAGRHPSSMQEAMDAIKAAGATKIETVRWDASESTSHAKVLGEVFDKYGQIDLVLVAAAQLGNQIRDELDPSAASSVMIANYAGLAGAMLVVAQRLKAQGQGTIVVLSSVAGVRVRRSNFIYGSSKAALDGFSQGLADSLANSAVRVLIVRPGFVKSKMTFGMKPVPFSTTPSDVAKATVQALAQSKTVIWVPGVLRFVFVVLQLLPRSIFRRIPG